MPEKVRAEIADTGLVEAVLFAAGNPMTVKEIAHIIELDVLGTQNIITRLQAELDERKSGLTLRQVAGGYQLATRPEAFVTVERLSQVVDRKISAPTMETLSIIAFKQPISAGCALNAPCKNYWNWNWWRKWGANLS